MTKLSVVCPVYNETRELLDELVTRLEAASVKVAEELEIILVDDGSRNDAWASIMAIAEAHPSVKGLRLSRNFGQHRAISAGLDNADGDWVVVMDSDLQDRPEVIPELYAMAQEGYDVVFVNRKMRPEGPIYRFFAWAFYRVFNFLAGYEYDRRQGNYSIISRDVADALKTMGEQSRFYGGMVRWLGFRQAAIDAQHGERFSGKSTYDIGKRFRFAFTLIVGFSTRLLYVSIGLGVLMALVSLIMAVWIIVGTLMHPGQPAPGWPSVITAIFFTAGVTNIVLGLHGIYLGRLYADSKARPIYVVGARTERKSAQASVQRWKV